MQFTPIKHLLLFLLLVSFVNCGEDPIEINTTDDFENYLQKEMEDQHIPALSILIFEDDDILYEKHLGVAHVQQNLPLESNHLFLLASVSKVITATALLQLYENGLFELDDKINDYLSFNVQIPNQTTDITFSMLLTHTSGIADGSALDGQYYYGEDSPVELSDFLEKYLVPNGEYYNASENFYDFEPGTQHEYTNIGNALIGLLVEEISGLNFNEYCKQNIFIPLEMSNTAWRLDEITQTIVQPYNYTNGQYEAIDHYTFTDYPNGGLRSTTNDLFKFLTTFVQEGASNNNHQLLQPTTVEALVTPQIPSIDNQVGLHLFVMNESNSLWGHDGGEQGVATIMAFSPATKAGVIILTNQGDADLDEILIEAYQLGLTL